MDVRPPFPPLLAVPRLLALSLRRRHRSLVDARYTRWRWTRRRQTPRRRRIRWLARRLLHVSIQRQVARAQCKSGTLPLHRRAACGPREGAGERHGLHGRVEHGTGGTPLPQAGPAAARGRCARDSYPTCEPLSRGVFLRLALVDLSTASTCALRWAQPTDRPRAPGTRAPVATARYLSIAHTRARARQRPAERVTPPPRGGRDGRGLVAAPFARFSGRPRTG